MKKLTDGDLKIIYKHNKPYGIRDEGGFLFFFSKVSKYSGQEERYRREIEQQYELANFLLSALNANTEESKPDRTFGGEFRPETVLAELTQFNDDGNKIAHFVYTLPDLNPQPKQESKSEKDWLQQVRELIEGNTMGLIRIALLEPVEYAENMRKGIVGEKD